MAFSPMQHRPAPSTVLLAPTGALPFPPVGATSSGAA